MVTEVVAAVDQGTQSTRVYLFDKSQQVVASHQVELRQSYPHAGWCEQDPQEIWETVQECITGALASAAKSHLGEVRVVALGITNQRETTILWSKSTGKPLHNAIVWLDTRTSEVCHRMQEELGSRDYFRPVTGLPINPYFSAFKYLWMYEHVPAVRAAVEAGDCLFGTVDTWLIYCLTGGTNGGVHVTDVTNASRTQLMDLGTLEWHQPFVELFKMQPQMLPRIASNAEVYGHVAQGPFKGVPICGSLGDQMAAMLGQRCVKGEAKNTYGTGCFMLLNTGPTPQSSKAGLLTTMAFRLGPKEPAQYALEGSVAVAGLGISWLQQNLGIINSPAESETLASQVPSTGGVYFVPAFSGLLAPHWDYSARGVIAGLSAGNTRAHVARAMLEALCFQTREVLDAMEADAGLGLKLLRVDGGATKNNLLMQLQADILQVPVTRPAFQETTSLGAALAAGLAVGFWTMEEVFSHSHEAPTSVFEPQVPVDEAQRRYASWHRVVDLCRGLEGLCDPLAEDENGACHKAEAASDNSTCQKADKPKDNGTCHDVQAANWLKAAAATPAPAGQIA